MKSGDQVGGTQTDQFAIGVNPFMALDGERLRHGNILHHADHCHQDDGYRQQAQFAPFRKKQAETRYALGNYWVAGMILVVSNATGGTSRQLANNVPEDLAKILLRSLVLASREGRVSTVLASRKAGEFPC